MNFINFCPYQESIEIKKLGFNKLCYALVTAENKYYGLNLSDIDFLVEDQMVSSYKDCTPAPLFQQAFRWFREKHELNCIVFRYYDNYAYEIFGEGIKINKDTFETYEEAELACLNKLIEIVKNK